MGIAFLLFMPAWTFDYWQAWVYISIFSAAVVLTFIYLFKNDQKLLERRLNRAEKDRRQKWIQMSVFMAYIGIYILPSLDHRFGWSNVPFLGVMIGDSLVALGYFIIFTVLKENSFASATIEIASDQKVVSTGLYALIRHPMYLGAIVMLGGTPLALGSWWGFLMFMWITAMLVWRLMDEEEFLLHRLSGYKEYCQKTRYRLLPFLW